MVLKRASTSSARKSAVNGTRSARLGSLSPVITDLTVPSSAPTSSTCFPTRSDVSSLMEWPRRPAGRMSTRTNGCTRGHYRRYLLDGELPEDEKVCEVDRAYFPGSEKKDVSAMSEEEMELSRVGAEMANAWLEVSR